MSDLVIPIRKDSKTKMYYVKFPPDFYGVKGNPKLKVSLKTANLPEARLRLEALALVAQMSNPTIERF